MPSGPIDWEHPPSTRRTTVATGPRLLVDGGVLAISVIIGVILVQALTGGQGVSARGVREFFMQALPGGYNMVWAVLCAVGLAGCYALFDLAAVVGLRRARGSTVEPRTPADETDPGPAHHS